MSGKISRWFVLSLYISPLPSESIIKNLTITPNICSLVLIKTIKNTDVVQQKQQHERPYGLR